MWKQWSARIHKWLGLTLTVWLVLVALTGTLLFYKTELLQLSYPQLKLQQVPTVAQAAAVYDRYAAGYAYLPRADKPWTEVVDGAGTIHYYDAAGELLLARPLLGDWLSWAVEFHHHLLLHELGKELQGIFGLLSLLLVVAGLVRWWPRHWSWRLLTVRWQWPSSRQFMATLWQLHRSVAMIALLPLLALLLTGTAIMYAAAVSSSLDQWLPERQTLNAQPLPQTRALNWQQRLELAASYWPDQTTRLLYLAPTEAGGYRMRLQHDAEWHPNGRSYLEFDTAGQLLSADDVRAKSTGFQLSQLIYPLHIAAVGGVAWLTALILGGLALMLLPITGVWFWWRRRAHLHKFNS